MNTEEKGNPHGINMIAILGDKVVHISNEVMLVCGDKMIRASVHDISTIFSLARQGMEELVEETTPHDEENGPYVDPPPVSAENTRLLDLMEKIKATFAPDGLNGF